MRKIKKRWLMKNLSALIACVGVLGNFPLASAQDVKPGDGEKNRVEISDSSQAVNGEVEVYDGELGLVYGGGDEESAELVHDNTVEIDGDTLNGVIGGVSETGNVEKNTVVINGGTINEGVVGGLSIANAEKQNTAGDVTGNTVIVRGGNLVNVSGGEVGYAHPRGESETITFESGGTVSRNVVKLEGGTINGVVIGGSALTGNALNNSVEITEAASINGTIIGGIVRNPNSSSSVEGNSIVIKFLDDQNPGAAPELSNVDLIGGLIINEDGTRVLDSEYISNNRLVLDQVWNVRVRGIKNFDEMSFVLPYDASRPALMITGGETTELNGTKLTVSARGNNNLIKTDQRFNLLQNDSKIIGSDISVGVLQKGVSSKYELFIEDDEGNTIAAATKNDLAASRSIDADGNFSTTGFHARVGELISGHEADELIEDGSIPHREAKRIIENNNKNWKPVEEEFREIDDENFEVSNEMKIFAGASGSSLRTKLSNGGHINNRGAGFGFGGVKTLVNKDSRSHFSFAPIIDYGHGKFDTYASDGKHGNGNTHFAAGGVIARKMNRSGFYYEGSIRYGRSRANFESNDFPEHEGSTYATYDMSAPIIAGHVNIGKVIAINRENAIHVFGQYYHSHQGSMSTDLSSGEHYTFDAVDGGTFITGIRFINQPNKLNKFYSSFVYQYDHSDDSVAHYDGRSTSGVDSNGSSGVFELGWEFLPHENIPWAIDLGATGWIGQQKGVGFRAKVKKAF